MRRETTSTNKTILIMRKLFLSLAALTIAVAANAFQVRMQNSDLGKNQIISSAVDNPDVFGDQKVSVKFDAANQTINIYLDNATLKATNSQDVFAVTGDEDYLYVHVFLKGKNAIVGAGSSSRPISVSNAQLYFETATHEDAKTASLDITGKTLMVEINGEALLMLGNWSGDAFPINMTTTSANQPVFYGSGSNPQLDMEIVDLTITASENNQVTQGLQYLATMGKIKTDGVSIKNNQVFVKEGIDYKGSLSIVSRCPVAVGSRWMYPDEADDFKPSALSRGKISYNKMTGTITLDNVKIDANLVVDVDNATIYLKNSNEFYNGSKSYMDRIGFDGVNATITGDKKASLTIYCNEKCGGISATEGLTIGDFDQLNIYTSTNGIVGNASTMKTDVLQLTTTPMYIGSSLHAIMRFENLSISSPYMRWSIEGAEYSTSKKDLVDTSDEDQTIKNVSLSYPVYLSFCDVEVTGRNKDNIEVEATSGTASYNIASSTLTLDNFNSQEVDPFDAVYAYKDLNIKLIGENILSASSDGIYADGNLTIAGNGSLNIKSQYNSAIRMAEGKTLTIMEKADVTAEGDQFGVHGDAYLDCTGSMNPSDPPTGTPAKLVVNNATLKASASTATSDQGAIVGFDIPTLVGVQLTEPANGLFVFECNSMTVLAGVIVDGAYAQSATIAAKTDPTAINHVAPSANLDGTRKLFRDGQLFILRGEELFNAQGTRVK